jgi:GTP-binding protein YchF
MALQLGLVGLPNAGKSTILKALSAVEVEIASYPFTTIKANRAMVAVPDSRLLQLSRMLNPPQTTPAHVEIVDIAGLVEGANRGEGLGNQFLADIRNVQAIIHVVRCFENPDVAHVYGSLDPVRDLEVVNTELMLSDMEILDRRAEKLGKMAKSGDKHAATLFELNRRMYGALQKGQWVRDLTLSSEEHPVAEEWGLLTAKPVLVVANVDEPELTHGLLVKRLRESLKEDLIVICGDLEAEAADLEPEEREELLKTLGLSESGLPQLIRAGYQALGLITFYTTVGSELRAWAIPKGCRAPQAAGKIHSDMEKGFIRAEVIGFEEFAAAGSLAQAKEKGLIRLEGKDYVIQDGDIVRFRFHV